MFVKSNVLSFILKNSSLLGSMSKSWEDDGGSLSISKRFSMPEQQISTQFLVEFDQQNLKNELLYVWKHNKLTKKDVQILKPEIRNRFLTTEFFARGLNNLYTLFSLV